MHVVFYKKPTLAREALKKVDRDDFRVYKIDSDRRIGSKSSKEQLQLQLDILEMQLRNLGRNFYERSAVLINVYRKHFISGVEHFDRSTIILLVPKNCPTLYLEGSTNSKISKER